MTLASARMARLTETTPKPEPMTTPLSMLHMFTAMGTMLHRFILDDTGRRLYAGDMQLSLVRALYPYVAGDVTDAVLTRLGAAARAQPRRTKKVLRHLSWYARGARYYDPNRWSSAYEALRQDQLTRFKTLIATVDTREQRRTKVYAEDLAADVLNLCYLPERITLEQVAQFPRMLSVKESERLMRSMQRFVDLLD